MEHQTCPDSWIDDVSEGNGPDRKAYGDSDPVNQITARTGALNVDAQPFVPGKNVFAKEFVPSFTQPKQQPVQVNPASNTSSIPVDNTSVSAQENVGQPADVPGTIPNASESSGRCLEADDVEKMEEDDVPDDWSDKSSEDGTLDEDKTAEGDDDSAAGSAVEASKPKKQAKSSNVAAKRKSHLNIVFIGHVDAGKSTIGGHIMYLTGQVDKRTLEKYEREAKEKNRESWYLSWALDTNLEERDKGKTVEVGRAFFETDSKHFTILDAPGHKSFVPNMIGGASQADVAVLVISARKGEFETGFERGGQTREHAMLVKTAGVRHLIIVVNKMDDPTVEWEEARFIEIREKLTPYLKKCGFNPKTDIFYIPVSGLI